MHMACLFASDCHQRDVLKDREQQCIQKSDILSEKKTALNLCSSLLELSINSEKVEELQMFLVFFPLL